jgi:putative ATP-dependent endonuclease of OLD family
MKIATLTIRNFRGIKNATLYFDGHTALVGDNNTGKSTILEAIDLVLGPERLSRSSIINEHDFFAGQYIGNEDAKVLIHIELVVNELNSEQTRHFRDHIEWWDSEEKKLLDSPPPEDTDKENVSPALRVKFEGYYDEDDDDFKGNTYCCSPELDGGGFSRFYTRDKRICGFLFLRTLRTGSRALSGKNKQPDPLSPKQTDHWKPGSIDPLLFDKNSKELFLSQRA